MISIQHKSDVFGAVASGLCLIHCIATPLLFIAHAHAVCCPTDVPVLWKSLDYIFLAISFIAIFLSTKTSSKVWIKFSLWMSWSVLTLVILNEKIQWFLIPEYAIYLPSLCLIFLHFYNLKYCKCKEDSCCVSNG